MPAGLQPGAFTSLISQLNDARFSRRSALDDPQTLQTRGRGAESGHFAKTSLIKSLKIFYAHREASYCTRGGHINLHPSYL